MMKELKLGKDLDCSYFLKGNNIMSNDGIEDTVLVELATKR